MRFILKFPPAKTHTLKMLQIKILIKPNNSLFTLTCPVN